MSLGIRQAVILAGGLGTRLRPITYDLPKPMVMLNNKPFLEYLVNFLKAQGIKEIVLLLGYMHEVVEKYFGNGSNFGVDIKYSIGDPKLDTGARLKKAEPLLLEEFILMYCDNYLPLNLCALEKFHKDKKILATVTIYTNKDNFTKSNMKVDENGLVTIYDKERKNTNLSGVDVGFFIIKKSVVIDLPKKNISFQKYMLPRLIDKKQLVGYLVDHPYFSIGNIERLPSTEEFLREKKVIFLDRDGVINKKAVKSHYIRSWNEFEFLPGAIETMKKLVSKGCELYIITNQAGIARNIMTEKDLREIHNKMKLELSKSGIKIKDIYYCPHGWDECCWCRKPNPGMFYKAAREHGIDLTKAIFVGDDERDIEAGKNANIKTLQVSSQKGLIDLEPIASELFSTKFK